MPRFVQYASGLMPTGRTHVCLSTRPESGQNESSAALLSPAVSLRPGEAERPPDREEEKCETERISQLRRECGGSLQVLPVHAWRRVCRPHPIQGYANGGCH